MRVEYTIRMDVDTNDYVKTLGEINDVLQDGLKGNPAVFNANIYIPKVFEEEE